MRPKRRFGNRALAIILAVVFAVVPFTGPAATSAAPSADNVIADGSALAAAAVAIANVDPDFDFWPIYSQSSMDNQSSHGLSGAIWPGFLLDAFAWLYGLQPQERGGLGISESQWPNPPHFSRGSSSGFMLRNFAEGCSQLFGAESCAQAFEAFGEPPLVGGSSESRSGELTSSGAARGARFSYPGVLEATEARSRTSSLFNDGKTVVESAFTMSDVTIGTDLHIDLIEARSTATAAGDREGSSGTSALRIVGARLGDTPVVIDSEGLHAAGDRGTDDLNELLAAQGLEVRASQGRTNEDDRGQFVDTATGGLLVRVLRSRAEEAFPEPLIEGKNAACQAAADNPLNEEITRIRVDQPNPLYGQVPIPGMPSSVQVEQSVPPPLSCPFFNRNFEVTLVLGLTNASARLSPLTQLGPPTFFERAFTAQPVPDRDLGYVIERTPAVLTPVGLPPELSGGLASSPTDNTDLPRSVRILYGVLLLLAAFGVAGRFIFRAASAP